MIDWISERREISAEEYVRHVTVLLDEASSWCTRRGLSVVRDVIDLNKEFPGKYEAPRLRISTDDEVLALVEPAWARPLRANGLVKLRGPISTHRLLLYVDIGPERFRGRVIDGKVIRSAARVFHQIKGNGFYWIEGDMHTPKIVDESQFIALISDVCGYEF